MNLIARTAGIVTTAAIIIVTFTGPGAQAQNNPSKPNAPKISPHPSKLSAGFIYGNNWLITYRHMNPNWIPDTNLANQDGLQEIFHPENWNSSWMSPSIQVAFSTKGPGVTIASEMARDAKNLRKQIPDCKVSSGPPLAITSAKSASVQIFTYKNGWDQTLYSDGGKVIFLTTLHCERAAQCAPFQSMFAKVARSLTYHGGIKAIDQTKSK